MYKYLVAFVLISPLVGIHMVENGEYAASIGVYGHDNGATIAFALFAGAVAVVAWLTKGQHEAFRTHRRLPNCRISRFGISVSN